MGFNLKNQLDVFLITNGRSTTPFAIQSIEKQQYVEFNFSVIRNKTWLDANQTILKKCKSKYFLRVDDDMFLHPKSVLLMWLDVEGQPDRVAMRGWKLWEPYSEKVIKGIKIYNHKACCQIGFRVNELGRIDKCFNIDAKSKGKKIKWQNEIMGIHACGNIDEHLLYAKMRGEKSLSVFKEKEQWMIKTIGSYRRNLEEQYRMATDAIPRINIQNRTKFIKNLRRYEHGAV